MIVEKLKKHKAKILCLLLGIVLFLMISPVGVVLASWAENIVMEYTPNFGNSPPSVTTIASSGYMDGTGTHATLTGSLDDLSIFPDADIWFEWGYNGNYDNTVGFQNVSSLDTYTQDIDGFNPTEPVNFRIVGENTDGTRYGDGSILQMQENAVLGGYRVVAVTPLVYTALIVVGLVGIMKVGLGVGGIVFGAIMIYTGSAFLEGIQGSLRMMWGG